MCMDIGVDVLADGCGTKWRDRVVPSPARSHDYKGHNYVGHYYMGHNYIGHNYIGHYYMAITV